MTSSPSTLNDLLAENLRYAPEYGDGLSNHLPMALYALQRLGAPPERLAALFESHAGKLSPRAAPQAPAAAWQEQFGRPDAFEALAAHFDAAIGREGVQPVVRQALPLLMPGVGAAAFHGLIRTAYALQAGHEREIAAALAYWACRHLPLAAPAGTGAPLAPADWLGALGTALAGCKPTGRLIFDRMQAVAATEAYSRLAGTVHVHAGTLAQLAAIATQRYLASRNFTVLHLVTSCHAMRLLLPLTESPLQAVRHYAAAYAAGFIASGIAPSRPAMDVEPLAWSQIVPRAIASEDEHVIKLVDSCSEEARVYGDTAYRQAASLAVAA